MSDFEIIQVAEKKGIDYEPFRLIKFVRGKENSGLSINEIIDEYEKLW